MGGVSYLRCKGAEVKLGETEAPPRALCRNTGYTRDPDTAQSREGRVRAWGQELPKTSRGPGHGARGVLLVGGRGLVWVAQRSVRSRLVFDRFRVRLLIAGLGAPDPVQGDSVAWVQDAEAELRKVEARPRDLCKGYGCTRDPGMPAPRSPESGEEHNSKPLLSIAFPLESVLLGT